MNNKSVLVVARVELSEYELNEAISDHFFKEGINPAQVNKAHIHTGMKWSIIDAICENFIDYSNDRERQIIYVGLNKCLLFLDKLKNSLSVIKHLSEVRAHDDHPA